ncbi:MAG: hypothetical protein RL277_2035 [Planctomycetota bacterium]
MPSAWASTRAQDVSRLGFSARRARCRPACLTKHPSHRSARVVSANSIDRSALDQDALRVVSRLTRQGYEAYLVGGCVRDLLIGRRPKDFDVATSAHPRQIKRLFHNGRIIGRRFRLVHIHYGDHIIETATFRRDPESRPPGDSELDADNAGGERELEDLLITEDNEYGTAEEDARRRDFTVNALFLDPVQNEIIDYVGGLRDLQDNLLRTIGDPKVRIAEDPVRILRGVKFATRLGLRIDEPTWEAMVELSPALSRSSPPRVIEEILRLLRSGSALGAFRMLRALGALRVILPMIDAYLGDPENAVDTERANLFWRLLEALDNDVHAGYQPGNAVCLALLALRTIEREADPRTRTLPGEAKTLDQVCAEVLEPLAIQARLGRRDCAKAQRLILLQPRFTQPASRRFRPLLFVRSEEFPEALELFRIRTTARGQGWDVYEGWLERQKAAHEASPEEVEAERKQSKPRRRRRRRRGKGSGKGSGGSSGGGSGAD